MPEGFNSVADLKVIVDANAEKFHSGMQSVASVIEAIGSVGNSSLGGLDKVMMLVGDTALGVRGKMTALTAGIEAGVAMYQKLAQEGRAVAEMLGVTEEYDRLKATIDDLGMSLQDAAVGAFFAVQSAGMDAASAMFGFASASDTASASADGFAARLLNSVTDALDRVRLNVRLLTDESGSPGRMGETLILLEKRIAILKEEIEQHKLIEEQVRQTGRTWETFGNDKQLAQKLIDLNGLEQEKIVLLERHRAAAEDVAQWEVSTATSAEQALWAEAEALEEKNNTLGMGAAVLARYSAEQKALRELEQLGIDMTPEIRAALDSQLERIRAAIAAKESFNEAERETQRQQQLSAQRERAGTQVFANAEREIMNLRLRAETVGMNARETAELTFYETKLQQLRASGNEPDRWDLVKLQAMAAQFGINTEKAIDNTEKLKEMGAVGQSVAGGLSSAFSQWTRGAELDVKSMVSSIITDLAQLTFKRSVLEPLFGGGSGAPSDGGLFGSLLGGLFGGFREGGGDVQDGRAYVVGEKRPELFIPSQNGTIVPQVPSQGAGGEVHVYVHGTPDFDARVVSTAEHVVVRRAPQIIGDSVAAVADYRERQGLD